MTEIGEIFFRKDKYGWIAYDRGGNSAKGLTKEHAKNNYLLAFGEIGDKIRIGLNMSNVERTLNA